MSFIVAVTIAGVAWFVTAAVSFFNPVVDKIYRAEEQHPAVRTLPQHPKTIALILLAVFAQTVLWAFVYLWVKVALPQDPVNRGLCFALVLSLTKMVPRDIDRLLLTTYPKVRMTVEFVVGILCAVVVGFVFSYWL